MRTRCAVLAAAAVLALPAVAAAGEPVYTEPIGIAMEGFPSPFPVKLLRLVNQGEIVNMAYMDVAPRHRPNGRTVLLMHGKNFDSGAFEPTIRVLSAAGYRVIAPDQVGFGRSSKPAIDYSFTMLGDNTVKLLDHLGIQRVDLVGHSLGGMVATRFALEHQDRVGRLVLANPVGLEDYRQLVPAQTTERLYADELANTDQAAIRAFYRAYVVRWRPIFERNVEIRSRLTLGAEYPRWAKASALTFQMAYNQPVVQDLPKLRVPTLLVIGQQDRTAVGKNYAAPEDRPKLGQYPVLGKRAAAAIPGSKLVEIDDAGHLPHLETPHRFNRAVIDFLD